MTPARTGQKEGWHKMILKLNPKYSRRVRALLRKYRFQGIQRLGNTVAYVWWSPERQTYTDKFIQRLIKIDAVEQS